MLQYFGEKIGKSAVRTSACSYNSRMQEVVHINKNGVTYALLFPRSLTVQNGIQFVTKDEDPLQVGIFERNTDYEVPPHRHLPRTFDLPHIAEFLSIESGTVRMKVFDEYWGIVDERTVVAGNCIVFLRGGHALSILEPARIMEVKQGPYPGKEMDKVLRDAP